MRSVIRRAADGSEIDLAGEIPPAVYAELEGSQGKSTRKKPLWYCGQCDRGMHITRGRRDPEQLFAAHFDKPEGCESIHINRPGMSRQHKVQQELLIREGSATGLDMQGEVTTVARTRVDVAAYDGGSPVAAFEVQRSYVTAATAMERTAKSVRAGFPVVAWSTDAFATVRPAWLGKVPGYRLPEQAQTWQAVPKLGSVRAIGVTDVDLIPWGRDWKAIPRLISPLIGNLIASLATGDIRPVMFESGVRLMTKAGVARWEDWAGCTLTSWNPGKPKACALKPSVEVKCDRPSAMDASEPPLSPFADFLAQSAICSRCQRYRSMASSGLCYVCRRLPP